MEDDCLTNTSPPPQQYMTTVKVGMKGQIVIPKEARNLFHITPGDVLILRADSKLGIAIQPFGMVKELFDGFFNNTTT